MEKNKFGVPYHEYQITLLGGDKKNINIGYEDDWGNIQQCTPGDCPEWQNSVGYGNDEDGHIEIVKVVDLENGLEIDPMLWAKNFVWKYVENYSS